MTHALVILILSVFLAACSSEATPPRAASPAAPASIVQATSAPSPASAKPAASAAAPASSAAAAPSAKPSAPPSPTTAPAPTIAPTVAPQSLTGTGQKAVPIRLVKGLLDAKMKYTGARNFAVTVLGPTGQQVALLANVIGAYAGEQATHVTADGGYALNVEASGPWTIDVTNVAALGSAGAPQPSAGKGPAVVAFSLKAGLASVTMKHNGARNFAVVLLNADGTQKDLLANVIGKFDGSKATGIARADVYLFNIEADGDWTMAVQQA